MNHRSPRFRSLLAAVAALVLAGAPAMAQGNASAPSGTEYYVGFMANDDDLGGAVAKFMGLMITSQVATVGTVEIPGSDPRTFSTRPGEFTAISVPRSLEHRVSEDTIGNGTESIVAGVRITSRAPITVFVVNARHQSSAGYAAVPVGMWGTHYLPLTVPNGLGKRTGELMIVAAYDDTRIRFTPSATTVRQDRGVPREIKLDRGRTYFVQADDVPGADLSGSEIIATRPVGVLTGHVRAAFSRDGSIPSDPQAYATHHAAMLLPDSLWGTEFASVPMRPSGDRFRVMPARSASVIITHYGPAGIGRDTLALDAGEARDVSMIDGAVLSGPVHWQSTAPAMVLQLRTSGVYGNPTESPAMLPLVSLDRLARRSAFIAPDQIGGGPFSSHTVTILAHVPDGMTATPVESFRTLTLDGTPLDTYAPNGEPRPVGTTGMYYATITVPSGGHILASTGGMAFTGYVGGENGTVDRDSYLWNLPSWGEPGALDVSRPYVIGVKPEAKGTVTVVASDRSENYFSGIGNVDVAQGNGGWMRTSYNAPQPEDDGVADFRAISDPSGPLTVTIRDRDGNTNDTALYGSVCFKTATAEASRIAIRTEQGKSGSATLELAANTCGDEANINAIVFGSGTIAVHLEARFENGAGTMTIAPNGRARLTVSTSTSVPPGVYQTTMRIAANDSILPIIVDVTVDPPSSAPFEREPSTLRIYPNPVLSSATIVPERVLDATATITVTDNLGRIVRTLDAADVAGRTEIVWDGRDDAGSMLPAGRYVLQLRDRSEHAVAGVTLVR